jgi:ATP-dependent helicase HrpA
VTLYGVPLVVGRTVGYARVDPVESRHLFIQRALVEGDWTTRHRFFHDNAALVERLSELEARTRRRDLLVGDEALYSFYDKRIPASVVSARHFDSWWKKAARSDPRLLTFTEDLLLSDRADEVDTEAYPTVWRQGDLELVMTYRFEPGHPEDGVTVHIPVEVLNRVTSDGFDWQVPGMREALVTALIRVLPKGIRRLLVPAPEHAAALVRELGERGLGPSDGALTDVLGRVIRQTRGVAVGPEDWDMARVPAHLRVHFAVEDAGGRVIALGLELDALREIAQPELRRQVSRAGSSVERSGLRAWDVGTIPDEVATTSTAGRRVEGYPALVDDGASVSLRVLPTRAEAASEHRLGVRRLLLLNVAPPWKQVLAQLTNAQKLSLAHNPHGSVPALLDDCLACAVDAIADQSRPREVRTPEAFAEALADVRTHLATRVVQVVGLVEPVLAKHLQAIRSLDTMTTPTLAGLVADVRAQLRELVRPGFVADAGFGRLRDLDRYLRAVLHRLDRAPSDLARDIRATEEVLVAEDAYAALLESLRPARRAADDVVALGWMLEELRVSLFAQSLGTAYPVSVKRILRAIAAIDRG